MIELCGVVVCVGCCVVKAPAQSPSLVLLLMVLTAWFTADSVEYLLDATFLAW